ncbi:MAG: hypothetical protein KAH17_05300 [Bacteroidales bacterium]|nr:hypothetical protein [Bacteroidales bacterium]
MNRLIMVFLILIVFQAINAQSNKYAHIEYENLSNRSNSEWFAPQINIYGSASHEGSRLGTYFFALLNPNWGEAYGGLSYQLTPWMSLNAGIGLETHSQIYRLNVGSFIAVNKLTLLQIYEYGGSGFWYSVILNYAVKPKLKTGLILKRYYGFGPNIEWNIGKSPVMLNVAPVYDFEFDQARLMVILRYAI